MTIKEVNKIDDLVHDIDVLKDLERAVKAGHWIKFNAPELYESQELRYFRNALGDFLQYLLGIAEDTFAEIKVSGLKNDE